MGLGVLVLLFSRSRGLICELSVLFVAFGALGLEKTTAATLGFAGRTWTIKQASSLVGPGPNRFSNSPSDVWSDAQGLHLTIHKTGSFWYSTEVILNESHGYGTYVFQTTSRQDILNANATFGAFTWDSAGGDTIPNNPNREIDFEDGRWGNAADPTNSQAVVQPYFVNGNLQRITLPDLSADAALTRFFTWTQNKIDFYTLRGHYTPYNFPPESVINHYSYLANGATHLVPTPGQENFRFNLWLFQSTAPVANQPVEVVVNDFAYFPPLLGDYNFNGVVDAADYVLWRKGIGTTYTQTDYGVWRDHFGQTAGSGLSVGLISAVPEPDPPVLLMLAMASGRLLRRRPVT
jgi:hypothetical protein